MATKVHALERKVTVHERNIAELADSMAELLATPTPPPKRPTGLINPEDKGGKKAQARKAKRTSHAVEPGKTQDPTPNPTEAYATPKPARRLHARHPGAKAP